MREFFFTDQDFQKISKLIYEQAGISLSASKKSMVYNRIARRLRANDLTRFDEYLQLLEVNDKNESEAFVNALTTNLTAFFREAYHFPLLASYLHQHKQRLPLKLWCSAASTGEEAYSMAMTVVQTLGIFASQVQIIATDLDTQVLKTAQAGIYSHERIENLDAVVVKRFFLKGTGSQQGFVKVRQELRDMISFQQLNLLAPHWELADSFDVIFCRNVMIYFDKETQRKILQKFTNFMRPDSLLFAGHSENFFHSNDLFELINKTVYKPASKLSGYGEISVL